MCAMSMERGRPSRTLAVLGAALACAALVAWADLHAADDVQPVLLGLIVLPLVLGLALPRGALVWGAIVGLAVPTAELIALWSGYARPCSPSGTCDAPSLARALSTGVLLVPALIGAASGARLRGGTCWPLAR